METYIAILRGINVSGHKKINMNELKSLFAALDYKNVRTYIQSGNVIFECEPTDPRKLSEQIEQKILEKYSFDVPVLIRTYTQLVHVIRKNPFIGESGVSRDSLYVTFLADEPQSINIDKMAGLGYEPDRFIISGKEVYVFCPNGYGRTKLTNNFFENRLKVKATTRNWKTLQKLAGMISPVS